MAILTISTSNFKALFCNGHTLKQNTIFQSVATVAG